MLLSELSLPALASWSNKLESHIVDLQQVLKTLQAAKSYNKFYDNDSKRSNQVVVKLDEITEKLNKIYAEIDNRSVKELGMDFEVKKYSELANEIDSAYLKYKAAHETKIAEETKNLLKASKKEDKKEKK